MSKKRERRKTRHEEGEGIGVPRARKETERSEVVRQRKE
jgi:hypothetical protein